MNQLWINKIKTRNRKKFYHSIKGLCHDIERLSLNAQLYNGSSNPIYKDSLLIVELLHKKL